MLIFALKLVHIIDLKCLYCVRVTVKIQFDNAITCKYSIIFTIRSVAMLPRSLGSSVLKNSGQAPVMYHFSPFSSVGRSIILFNVEEFSLSYLIW